MSTKSIKQRIRSVRNIGQITKAMEVVSATKMRKSQEFALKARPYAAAALEMLQNLLLRTPRDLVPPLLKPRPVKIILFLVVTSDKGLAGALNANVLRKAEARIGADTKADQRGKKYVVTVGKKAKDYFERRGGLLYKSFSGFGDYSTLEQTMPVADLVLEGFMKGEWDEVEAIYMNFRTTLLQEVSVKKILPVTLESIQEAVAGILPERGRYAEEQIANSVSQIAYQYEYKFEPSPGEILNALVPQLLRMHIHHIILESNASEHSARMVAMKNASDNARELIGDLTLAYNKARQAGITNELIEITAGREALEG
jgi:F-type H+-transporting ATPase subunit gamma